MKLNAKLALIFWLTLLGPTQAWAKESASIRTNSFSVKAEIIPRYPGVGEDEVRNLHFTRWFPLNDRATIGLTEDGQIYGSVSVQKHDEHGKVLRKTFAIFFRDKE